MKRVISVSTVAYDGYPLAEAFSHIKGLGVSYVEVAFIQGYIEAFSEKLFSIRNAREVQKQLKDNGLFCYAFSAHIDLGEDDAVERFIQRMEFANKIGAKLIFTNSALRSEKKQFFSNLEKLIKRAESFDLIIGLENPGDGKDNLMNTGEEAAQLIEKINSPLVRLNYDFGNLITHFGGKKKPENDGVYAVPHCVHFHIKDVSPMKEGWEFPAIGKGIVGYKKILKELVPKTVSMSLEVPVRLRRRKDASPYRLPEPVPLDITDAIVKESLAFVMDNLVSPSM